MSKKFTRQLALFTTGLPENLTEDVPLARSVLDIRHCREWRAVLCVRGHDLRLRAADPCTLGSQALEPDVAGVMLIVHYE
jgi:hypothetical protein